MNPVLFFMGAAPGVTLARDIIQEILRRGVLHLCLENGDVMDRVLDDEIGLRVNKKRSQEKFFQGYFGSSRLRLLESNSSAAEFEKAMVCPGRLQHLAWLRYGTGESLFASSLHKIRRKKIPLSIYLMETDFMDEDWQNAACLSEKGVVIRVLPPPHALSRKVHKETHALYVKNLMNDIFEGS